MSFLAALFVRWGLSQRVSGVLAYVVPIVAARSVLVAFKFKAD